MRLKKEVDITLRILQVFLIIMLVSTNDFTLNIPTLTVFGLMIMVIYAIHVVLTKYGRRIK